MKDTINGKVDVYVSERVCDTCGHKKPLYGGKTCSKGHFHCKACASGHQQCKICGHTIR